MKKNFICLVILSLVGCTTSKQLTTENTSQKKVSDNPIEGTWVLKNVLMGDAMDAPCGFSNEDKVKEMNVTFTSEKTKNNEIYKLHGQSSVNSFSGQYVIQSYDTKTKTGKIKFEPLASTKMAGNQDFMDCETRYFTYLQKSEDFKIVDGKLQLIKSTPLANDGKGNSPFGESYKNVLYFYKK
jgi:hypothetical protein